MKIGVNLRIDVNKIEKARLYKGQKCTYLDLTTFIDINNEDQYGHNGFVKQSISKEDRDRGVDVPILGNVDVFYNDSQQTQQSPSYNQPVQHQAPQGKNPDDFDDDIPF